LLQLILVESIVQGEAVIPEAPVKLKLVVVFPELSVVSEIDRNKSPVVAIQ
jgi:hypothetical protein